MTATSSLNSGDSGEAVPEKQAFAGFVDAQTSSGDWLIDSGSTDHMTNWREWCSEFTEYGKPVDVTLGDGKKIPAYGFGNIEIETAVNEKWNEGTIFNVLYVPGSQVNLFSLKVAVKKGINFKLDCFGKRCLLIQNRKIIAMGSELGNLYKINLRVISPKQCLITKQTNDLQLWHERLSHQNKKHVKNFLSNITVSGDDYFCDGCAYGKQHRCFP